MKWFKPKVYGGPPKKVTRLSWVMFYCLIASPFVLILLGLLIKSDVVITVGAVGLVPLALAIASAG